MKLTGSKKIVLPVALVVATLAVVLQTRGFAHASSPVPVTAPELGVQAQSTAILAEGRLVTYPGAQVSLSSEVEGRLAEVRVQEKDTVKKGDVLAVIDTAESQALLAEAQAQALEAEAQVRLARSDAARHRQLLQAEVVTAQKAEVAQRDLETARAQLAAARARVQRLRTTLGKAQVVAPIDGVVLTRAAQPGELVRPGTALVTIANLERVRIEAEVDEFDAGRVELGAPVAIQAEGFAEGDWAGRIEEIPDAVMPRRLRPQDPGRPQDTRVLLVKVALDGATPLKLGQRVEVRIETQPRVAAAQGGAEAPRPAPGS